MQKPRAHLDVYLV